MNLYNSDVLTSTVGLTSVEARKRLASFGTNELANSKSHSTIKILLSQFNDFITWILIIAVGISTVMGERADAITILIIVILNGILGFFQEFKTERSLEALKSIAAPTAKVLRDGNIIVIKAREIVPGDVILLESGDVVPADCTIISGDNITVDESMLTGESTGVTKGVKNNNLYMGSSFLTGKGRARVLTTGMKTEMGKIAKSLDEIVAEKSHLKEKLDSLGKILVFLCILICAIVTILGVLRGQNLYLMLLLGVSLAVAAIPEGLTAIVTVALALGVSRMLKRKTLIRKLPAVETLGCTSVICTDKTGTLTENKMTLKKIYIYNKLYSSKDLNLCNNEELLNCIAFCNDCNYDISNDDIGISIYGDPTEKALITGAFSSLNDYIKKREEFRIIKENTFDSDRKMMSVLVRNNKTFKETCYVKGAPESILKNCKYILQNNKISEINESIKKTILKNASEMSLKALRCIGIAYKLNDLKIIGSLEQDLIFICIAGIIDPPKSKVKAAVEKCMLAGIRPIMITGDHKNTAFAIAEELNICKDMKEVLTGTEIDELSDYELSKKILEVNVFARVTPFHKLKIVKAFKASNCVVAMTGDGVNDAPAVKEADIGIAMGLSGSDVTKEAASMIILDDDFSTIVNAVEEGRLIYNNIRKFIRYLLSCNLGEVITMFLTSILYLQSPLIPIQILLVNLVTDGLPAIALGMDPAEEDIMYLKPRKKNESVFANGLMEKILIRGSLIGLCTVMSFITAGYYGMNIETARTIALSTLIISQLLHVFECRSENHSVFEVYIFSNLYLLVAVFISIAVLITVIYNRFFQEIFHCTPLLPSQWCIVIFFSGVIFFINSLYLYLINKK